MSEKLFVSGDEAVALAVRQAKPHVIAAYPITPQTIVVERLADYVEDGSLDCQYMYVESEHSAMSAVVIIETLYSSWNQAVFNCMLKTFKKPLIPPFRLSKSPRILRS